MSLAAVMAIGVVPGTDARGPARAEATGATRTVTPAASYVWSLTNVLCHYTGGAHGYGGITGRAKIRENGTSGTTWLRMTAKYRRLWSGARHTTQTRLTQSSHQFANNSNWHSITWNVGFDGRLADSTHSTRLYVLYEWFNNNTRIFWATRWSGGC